LDVCCLTFWILSGEDHVPDAEFTTSGGIQGQAQDSKLDYGHREAMGQRIWTWQYFYNYSD